MLCLTWASQAALAPRTSNQAYQFNNWYQAYFIQDDWKVAPSLTVSIGLRMEHETPEVESLQSHGRRLEPHSNQYDDLGCGRGLRPGIDSRRRQHEPSLSADLHQSDGRRDLCNLFQTGPRTKPLQSI